jgi:shikimate kinase
MNKCKNISLTGFMGSGKSTVGRILAEELNLLFVDLDNIIEISEGMKISGIFETYGEKYFRDVESSTIRKIYRNEGCVISCGGGVILRSENMEIINSRSVIIFLDVSASNVLQRLKCSNDRPLLSARNRDQAIEELLSSRISLYKKYCDFPVDTNDKKPEEISREIEQIYKSITGRID